MMMVTLLHMLEEIILAKAFKVNKGLYKSAGGVLFLEF